MNQEIKDAKEIISAFDTKCLELNTDGYALRNTISDRLKKFVDMYGDDQKLWGYHDLKLVRFNDYDHFEIMHNPYGCVKVMGVAMLGNVGPYYLGYTKSDGEDVFITGKMSLPEITRLLKTCMYYMRNIQ